MDARIFAPGLMGLGAMVHARPRQSRSARVARWHAAREAASR
jgi:propionate CoA-transferase